MQKIMADYESRHAGSVNTGRPLVLAEGMKVERISSTLDDTGLGEARSFSVQEVSRLYGVPVSMLSGETGAGYGTMEWLSRMYVDGCLQHWLHAWQAEVLLKLASPFDTMSWDLDALIRPGIAEHMAALRTGVEAGFLTRNEARARLDLPPLPGLDEPTLALNVGTGGGTTNIGDDTSASEGTPNDF
jgi:HK97 family phage portal protein